MNRTRQWVKRALAALLHYSGALRFYAAIALRDKAVVLTYHRVLPAANQHRSFSAPAIIVTPETFARHLRCVHRWLKPLPLEQFRSGLAQGALPSRACVITFDDGWYDNLEYALPIIQRERTPIALFAATGFVGGKDCFWQEKLAALVFTSRLYPERTQAALEEIGAAHLIGLDDDAARAAAFAFVARTKTERKNVDAIIERLRALLAERALIASEDQFLSVDQLRQLAESGWVEIGSHGVSHTRLPFIDDAQLKAELMQSRSTLSEWLGKTPATLAYPNGDFDARVMQAAREAGYALGFTTERGWVAGSSNALALKRINMHEAAAPTEAMFMCRVLGLM